MKLRIPSAWAPYLLVSPFLALFAVFGLFPLVFSLWLAFQSWEPTSGIESMKFVGLDNFVFALTDGWFWKSLRNTLWLAVATGVPQHLVALPLAVFLHQAFGRWRGLFSGAYFLPYITSTVAIAMLFGSLFSTDYGIVNQALHAMFGTENINWMRSPQMIKPAVAIVVFWRYVGFNLVLYLAALQTIPHDLYQAAKLDGANVWQQFLRITLPGLRPMILFGVTLSVIGGLQLFEEPFILTNGKGGADQAAMTVAMYLYRLAFDFSDFGGASALAWIMFGVIAALTWLTNKAFAERRGEGMKTIPKFTAYAIVGIGALIMLAPFYFMFVFATQSRTDIFNVPPPLWFSDQLLNNIAVLATRLPFWKNVGWSLYVGLMSTALTLLFCSMAGYAFAMLEFRFKKALFALVMGTMMVPAFMNMIPSFMVMDALGWIDTHRALYLPGAASAFGIFLMRQFAASTVPHELLNAARIDGASELGIYWRIALPLMKPALGTLGLITFISSWNNFMNPLIVLRSADNYTLPLALRSLFSTTSTEWGALMAGSAIATLPLVVLFVVSSRQLIAGLTAGAVK